MGHLRENIQVTNSGDLVSLSKGNSGTSAQGQGVVTTKDGRVLHPLDELPQYPINYSIRYRMEVVIASFCCANISTINLVLRRLESYDGVNGVEPITITSGKVYQNWLRNEIDNRIISQKYSSLSSSATLSSASTNNNDR